MTRTIKVEYDPDKQVPPDYPPYKLRIITRRQVKDQWFDGNEDVIRLTKDEMEDLALQLLAIRLRGPVS
jgi:hypothetical protein